MPKEKNKKIQRVGASLVLVPVSVGSLEFEVSQEEFKKALGKLEIPLLLVDGREFFSLFSLEQVLFEALRPGRGSWSFGSVPPGYSSKRCSRMSHFYEMGLAGLTYSSLSGKILRERVKNVARALYRRTLDGRK